MVCFTSRILHMQDRAQKTWMYKNPCGPESREVFHMLGGGSEKFR